MFIASDEIVCAIHLQIQYDTADEQVYRYRDRWARFVLETNIFGAGHAFHAGGDEHFSAGDTRSELLATSKQNLYWAHLRKRAL